MSKIYLFRHAQASYLSANYDQLSSKGEQQSMMLGKMLRSEEIRFDKIYRGPLHRHKQTVDIASIEGVFCDTIEILNGLKEHQAPATLKMLLPTLIENDSVISELSKQIAAHPDRQKYYSLKIFDHFMEGWTTAKYSYEGLQDWKNFKKEVSDCFKSILKESAKGETIGIFTSGGTITAILHHILKLNDNLAAARLNVAIQNASTTELLFNQNNCSLFKFNQVHYLPKEYHTFV